MRYSTDHFSHSSSSTSPSSTTFASMPPLHTMPQSHMTSAGSSRQSIPTSDGPRVGVGPSQKEAVFGQYPTIDKAFTNQSAYQNTFTPHGFCYESPFAYPSVPNYAFDQAYTPTTSTPQQQHYQNHPAPVITSAMSASASFPASSKPWTGHGSATSAGPVGSVKGDVAIQKEPSKKIEPRSQYPATNIATGPRFSELLAAKLGLTQPPPPLPVPQPHSIPVVTSANTETSSTLGSHAKFTYPAFALTTPVQNPFSASEIENNLLDSSQITISPEYVAAPFPAEFYPWAMQNRRQALAMSLGTTELYPSAGPQFVVPSEEPVYLDPTISVAQTSPTSSAMGHTYLSPPSITLANPSQSPVANPPTALTPMQMNVSPMNRSPPLLHPPTMTYSTSLPIPQPSEAVSTSPVPPRPTSWAGPTVLPNVPYPTSADIALPTLVPPIRDTKKPKFSLRASISASSRISALSPSTNAIATSVAPVAIPGHPSCDDSKSKAALADPADVTLTASSSVDRRVETIPVNATTTHISPTLAPPALNSSSSGTSPRAISPRTKAMPPAPPFSPCKSITPPAAAGSNVTAVKKRKRSLTGVKPVSISPKMAHHRANSLDSSKSKTSTSTCSVSKSLEEEGEKKIIIACHRCRSKKLRCDGVKPRCHQCSRHDLDVCEYDEVLKRRGPGKNNKKRDRLKVAGKDGVGHTCEEVQQADTVSL